MENNEEKLANAIMEKISELKGPDGAALVIDHFFADIGDAACYATTDSLLEEDFKKFYKNEVGKVGYRENERIEKNMMRFSQTIGSEEKVDFQTKLLFDYLESKAIEAINNVKTLFEMAVLIYAIGGLYGDEYFEKLSSVIDGMQNSIQKGMAVAIGRIYIKEFEGVLFIFRPGNELKE